MYIIGVIIFVGLVIHYGEKAGQWAMDIFESNNTTAMYAGISLSSSIIVGGFMMIGGEDVSSSFKVASLVFAAITIFYLVGLTMSRVFDYIERKSNYSKANIKANAYLYGYLGFTLLAVLYGILKN